MKLFVSSYRAGNYRKNLMDLFGKNCKVAIISNSKDYQEPTERRNNMKELLDFFVGLNMEPEELDLRLHFKKPKTLDKKLDKYQAFWMAGGNAFLLRRALAYTGLDKRLYDKVSKNEIIYGGESAGAIVAGPTLRGSEDYSGNEDNPNFVPAGYDKKIIWDGLSLVSYVPVPHYKSPNLAVAQSIDGYEQYVKDNNLPYKTMLEHQAILIDGEKEEFLK